MNTATPPIGIFEEDADEFPFGPVLPNIQASPVLLYDIASTIRACGGDVWGISKQPDGSGILFRANKGHKQFRVLVPPTGQPQAPAPAIEKGTPVHVVASIHSLTRWLANL